MPVFPVSLAASPLKTGASKEAAGVQEIALWAAFPVTLPGVLKPLEGEFAPQGADLEKTVHGRNDKSEVSERKRLTEGVELLRCPSRSNQGNAKLAARAVSELG
jgi:hypothetical protein